MSLALRFVALAPLLILSACNAGEKSELAPQPPIWVVSDADSEITLYPTLHILPKEVQWKSEELTRRLSEAEEVWFEIIPGSESDPALQQTIMRLGMAPGSSLSKGLSPDEVTKLRAAIAPLGMPYEAIDQMRPWMASTVISVGALVANGFDPDSGVEKHLAVMTSGKKIRALETAEDQMRMLASLPEDTQIQMLKDTLADLDESIVMLREVASDWAVGDVEDLEGNLIKEMKTEMPSAYDVLFTKRNENWVDQIEIEMKGSGTDFIAVGAGHLVGDEGVPALLKANGYTVKRL